MTILGKTKQPIPIGQETFLNAGPILHLLQIALGIYPDRPAVMNHGFRDFDDFFASNQNAPRKIQFFAIHKEFFIQPAQFDKKLSFDEKEAASRKRPSLSPFPRTRDDVATKVEAGRAVGLN